MKGYSNISVLAMAAALGTGVFYGSDASAQQYSPVSVDNSVQVNWDVADGFGDQPTVPQYLSPTVSREHIVMPGGDLIYPETRPKSEFLAGGQFAGATASGSDDSGYETVVIDGAGSGNAFPSQSEFYGVPGVSASAAMDDGAKQTIALQQPEPTSAPRSKPAAPVMAESSASNTPTPLTKPAPEPAPAAPTMAAAPVAAPTAAPAAETAEVIEPPKAPPLLSEDSAAPAAPSAPVVEPIAKSTEVPPAPAPSPDTTQSAPAMAEAAPKAEPAPAPQPVAEEAAIPPASTAPAPMPASGGDEYSLGFAADSFELSSQARSELDQVIAAMNKDDSLRIQLQAYAQGDGANASKARRLSLSRALQVRSYLIDQGVRSTRIDVRALGSNVPSGPADRVDIKTVQR